MVSAFGELDEAKQNFVQIAQESGALDQDLAGLGYDTLLTQNRLPDMRLAPNRHNPDLVRAYGRIVEIQEKMKQSNPEQEAKKEELQSPFEELKIEPAKPTGKKKK